MISLKNKKMVRKIEYGVIIVLLAGILGYRFVYLPLAIRHDKQRFIAAQASLEQLFNQIQDKVGKPDQVKRENSCSRAHLKSERGPLGCDVDISLLYEKKNHVQATQLMDAVEALHDTGVRIGSGSASGVAFKSLSEQAGQQIFYQDIPNIQKLSCALSYHFPVQENDYENTFILKSPDNFGINISCSGPAKAEHFPVKS